MNLLDRVQERRIRLWTGWDKASAADWLEGKRGGDRRMVRIRGASALLRGIFWCIAGYAGLVVVIVLAVQGCEAKAAAHPQMDAERRTKGNAEMGGCGLTPAQRTAIETVESGGDPKAWKKDEDARGIIQIREIYVADANRILGEERFAHDDAFDPAKAWQIFEVVTSHYIQAYGYADTFEVRARIHNGGPRGPTRKSTLGYWRKVQAAAT